MWQLPGLVAAHRRWHQGIASTVCAGRLATPRCMDRISARASTGQRAPSWKPTRFCQRIPAVIPRTRYGPTPLSTAARSTRSGDAQAQASAYGPPPDAPATLKRSNPSRSAASPTSADQPVIDRPGWKSDSP